MIKLSSVLLTLLPTLGVAQQPPIRIINQPVAVSKPVIGAPGGVRELPDGHILVNDLGKRQVVIYDSTLSVTTIAADSTIGARTAATTYGLRAAGMLPYFGDSTLFIDAATMSTLVIDPHGKVARVASLPRARDVGAMISASTGLDPKGRLVYLLPPQTPVQTMHGGPNMQVPDTSPVVRVDLATRKVDTIAYIKAIAMPRVNVSRTDDGHASASVEVNPLPTLDVFAVLSDGSVAIVRGRDYRVDWLGEDGAIKQGKRIGFPWMRMSDEDKIAFIDSGKKVIEAVRRGDVGSLEVAKTMGLGLVAGGDPGTTGMEGGGRQMIGAGSNHGESRGGGGAGAGHESHVGVAGAGWGGSTVNLVPPSELPDYRPAFTSGAARGDADGNLWVMTTIQHGIALGPVYDVIDRGGTLIDRVQLPAGRLITGFGKGGVVYMASRDGTTWRIEKARLR